jgi:hypothetical protein
MSRHLIAASVGRGRRRVPGPCNPTVGSSASAVRPAPRPNGPSRRRLLRPHYDPDEVLVVDVVPQLGATLLAACSTGTIAAFAL